MIKLLFCGDVFLANTTYTKGIGLGSRIATLVEDENIPQILELANNCDIAFCNLETPLSNNKNLVIKSSFIGYSNIPKLLLNSKIKIVSIANNHILDYGTDGFYETIKILEENNLDYIGKFDNGLSNIKVYRIKNVSLGFAAFNGVDLKKINNPGLFTELNEKTVKLTIDKMEELKVDCKVLSFHWGDEYISYPSIDQIKLGHFAIDNGADIIVGHHPHVIQPIENYKDGVIFYSLGNCIFDFLHSTKFRKGMIIKVLFDEINKKISYEILPIYLNYNNFFKITANRKKKYFEFLDKKLSEALRLDDNYKKKYKKKLKISHFLERILMKFHLIKLLIIGNNKQRMIFFKNIKNYLSKKNYEPKFYKKSNITIS